MKLKLEFFSSRRLFDIPTVLCNFVNNRTEEAGMLGIFQTGFARTLVNLVPNGFTFVMKKYVIELVARN